MAACWSASEPANQGDAAPWLQAAWKQTPCVARRPPGELPNGRFLFQPLGYWAHCFFPPVSVGEWNRVEWKPRPSLHDGKTQESLSPLPDNGAGMTSFPWAAKAIQANPVLPDPGPLPEAEAEAGRVWPKARQLGEVSVISSFLDESLFHDELKGLVWACLFFFFPLTVECFCRGSLWQKSSGVLVFPSGSRGLARTRQWSVRPQRSHCPDSTEVNRTS